MAHKKWASDKDRLAASVVVDQHGCWVWQRAKDGDGYGQVKIGSRSDGTRRQARAHSWAFGMYGGVVPDGLVLDHLCRNRACCNPAHMEPVTAKVNTQRGMRATATVCPNGHPYEGSNLIIVKATGRRRCKECQRLAIAEHGRKTNWAAQRAFKERRKSAPATN